MITGNLPFSVNSNCAFSSASRSCGTSRSYIALSILCPNSADSNIPHPPHKTPHHSRPVLPNHPPCANRIPPDLQSPPPARKQRFLDICHPHPPARPTPLIAGG